jgi:MscS family membrane protein
MAVLIFWAVAVPTLAAQDGPDGKSAEGRTSEAKSNPPSADPLNRLTPQSSVIAFLELCRANNLERASKYLDLRGLPWDQRVKQGASLARQLGDILNRDAEFDVAALSKDPQGDLSDGLPPDRERVISYNVSGRALELQLTRIGRRSGLAVWIFSRDSIDLIPQLSLAASDSPVEKYLPPRLVRWTILDTSIWRWIGLVLLMILVVALSRRLTRLAMLMVRPISKRIAGGAACDVMDQSAGPLQLLLAVALLRGGLAWVAPAAIVRLYLDRLLILLIWAGAGWLLMQLTDLGVKRARALLEARHSTFSRSGLPLASRIAKAMILMFAITAVLSAWGYNTTTILAGLGIGGIAIALAAQKTIENLFGGVAVISDRPVAVGDLCKFGDRFGTVEDIGVRSTRIRTLDRTVLTVPNSEFSSVVLENYSRRDKLWFHPTLNLRRDATPDQVRTVLEAIAHILTSHPNVETGKLPVRFIGVGAYSLDIEVFAYITTADFDTFLKIQQELLLQIMDAVVAAGTALALPTQVLYAMDGRPAEEPASQRP